MPNEKQDIRSLSKEARKEIKRAVFKLFEKGWRVVEIARELEYSKDTVYRWEKIWRREGMKGLEEKPRGGARIHPPMLTPELEKEIQQTIIDKSPDQLKMKFSLWNSRAIRDYIKAEHKVTLADRTVRQYMQQWGFTSQRPRKQALQQDSKEVSEWLEEKYPTIKQEAKRDKAEIYWADETGVSNREHNVKGYAPKGKTPVLRTSGGKRIRLNMISALNNQGKLRFMIYRENMSPKLFITFMQRLWKDAGRKIYLIVDNLKTHHSKLVQSWLESNKEKIRLYYLPKYSPELNPDEYLNNDLKKGLSTREPSLNEEHMENKIRSHMMRTQRNPEKVKRFFRHERISYAA